MIRAKEDLLRLPPITTVVSLTCLVVLFMGVLQLLALTSLTIPSRHDLLSYVHFVDDLVHPTDDTDAHQYHYHHLLRSHDSSHPHPHDDDDDEHRDPSSHSSSSAFPAISQSSPALLLQKRNLRSLLEQRSTSDIGGGRRPYFRMTSTFVARRRKEQIRLVPGRKMLADMAIAAAAAGSSSSSSTATLSSSLFSSPERLTAATSPASPLLLQRPHPLAALQSSPADRTSFEHQHIQQHHQQQQQQPEHARKQYDSREEEGYDNGDDESSSMMEVMQPKPTFIKNPCVPNLLVIGAQKGGTTSW